MLRSILGTIAGLVCGGLAFLLLVRQHIAPPVVVFVSGLVASAVATAVANDLPWVCGLVAGLVVAVALALLLALTMSMLARNWESEPADQITFAQIGMWMAAGTAGAAVGTWMTWLIRKIVRPSKRTDGN